MNDILKCLTCGCEGNQSCGNEPLNKEIMCALNSVGECGCCELGGHPKVEDDRQLELLEG